MLRWRVASVMIREASALIFSPSRSVYTAPAILSSTVGRRLPGHQSFLLCTSPLSLTQHKRPCARGRKGSGRSTGLRPGIAAEQVDPQR